MSTTDQLHRDRILDEASARTGGLTDLDDGHGSFGEGLDRVLDALRSEADLNELGMVIAAERMILHTVNRLHYVEDRRTDPTIAQQAITTPVFIIGMPRTGTTMLHDILAQDPANRAPLTWETMFPSPPPATATFTSDPRIELCAALFPDLDEQMPEFKAIHPMGAELSQECVTMMGEAMITPLFHNQFRVPSYEDWVDTEADWSHVYELHRRQLQHLQSHHALDRWVLKTGAHLWGLEHLLATYPDARIVFTHRDPTKSMTSYASLTEVVRRVSSDSVDPFEVAADWTPRLRDVLLGGIRVRDAREYPDAMFLDVRFGDFVRDQFAVVASIYDAFGLPMTDEAERAMRAFIAANPQHQHGVHEYSPEQFGIDPDRVRSEFAEYSDHFDLGPE